MVFDLLNRLKTVGARAFCPFFAQGIYLLFEKKEIGKKLQQPLYNFRPIQMKLVLFSGEFI